MNGEMTNSSTFGDLKHRRSWTTNGNRTPFVAIPSVMARHRTSKQEIFSPLATVKEQANKENI